MIQGDPLYVGRDLGQIGSDRGWPGVAWSWYMV